MLVDGELHGPLLRLRARRATISSLKRPPSFAAAHAFCERSAYSSHSWREMLVLLGEVLGGDRHRHAGVAVGERVPQGVAELLLLAERQAPARAAHDVRRLRHRLGAADEHDLRLAEQDLLGAVDDRLEAGAAEAIDRERGGARSARRRAARRGARGRSRRPRSAARCRRRPARPFAGSALACASAALAASTARSVAVRSLRLPPKVPNAVRLAPTIQISRARLLAISILSFKPANTDAYLPLQVTMPITVAEHAFFVGDDLAGDRGGGDVER